MHSRTTARARHSATFTAPVVHAIAESAELVGNYAIKIRFSDGHDTGLYSWTYLREIDPNAQPGPETPQAHPKP